MNKDLVSSATRRNWKRLGVNEQETQIRLSRRANKKFSSKNIIPVEYFKNIKNITYLENILNTIKEQHSSIENAIYNLALNILSKNNLAILKDDGKFYFKKNALNKIFENINMNLNFNLYSINLPIEETDFLGIVYQSLLKEGQKNIIGSYYTPKCITQIISESITGTEKFLDPCCGTGSFLLSASDKIKNPLNLYGADLDPIACFIAKINLIVKFKNIDFIPNIYNIDFLEDGDVLPTDFDIIATNPPWGAKSSKDYSKYFPQINSKESFSYFIVRGEKNINNKGCLLFVLPESILNVASHKDIRKFILDNFHITNLKLLKHIFSGVLSNVVLIKLDKNLNNKKIEISTNSKTISVSQEVYDKNYNYNFSLLSDKDSQILDKIYSAKYYTLSNSTFALGIVTGNNKKYISNKAENGFEQVYTGKEVGKYFLKPCTKYINYTRESMQQVAPEIIYRSSEKLIYKFISSKLVFAYDNSGSLFLNSANILIPKIENYNTKTVMAYLNSKLFEFIYMKKFNEIKILKNNLMQLPFPKLTHNSNEELSKLVDLYLQEKNIDILNKIDKFIYKSFNLNKSEIEYIINSIK